MSKNMDGYWFGTVLPVTMALNFKSNFIGQKYFSFAVKKIEGESRGYEKENPRYIVAQCLNNVREDKGEGYSVYAGREG